MYSVGALLLSLDDSHIGDALYLSWEDNFSLIARKGTIVSIGNASGAVPPFAPLKLAAKNLKVVRPTYVLSAVSFCSNAVRSKLTNFGAHFPLQGEQLHRHF